MEPTRAQLLREAAVAEKSGNLDEALVAIERAVGQAPKDAELLVRKSALLRALGRAEDARAAAHRATVLQPTMSAAHAALGIAFVDLRRPKEAERSFERALQYDRRNVEAYLGLARLRLEQQRGTDAEVLLAEAIRGQPQDARLFVLLGDAFALRANHVGMLEAYRRARDLDPLNSEALKKHSAATEEIGGVDAARASLEEAVARMPDSAAAHELLGQFLANHGLLEEAVASFHRAIEIEPDRASAHVALAGYKKFPSRDDADLARLRDAHDQAQPSSIDRAALAFALGKALDDVRDYEAALEAYLEGNRLRRQSVRYAYSEAELQFERIGRAYSAELLGKHRGGGHSSAAPIFIVGMPRSGTTLTETILSRHPDVHPAGELEFMTSSAAAVVGYDPGTNAERFVARLTTANLAQIGATYLGHLDGPTAAARRFTDKMPHNFRLIGLIRMVFPAARIVHVQRDPVDNCLSMFKAHFTTSGLAFTFDLGEIGRYYNLYRGLMRHWRGVLPGAFHDVQYEQLVTTPEATTRALFDYCGLDWTPDVLEIEKSRREVQTASIAQVRQPINTGSVNAGDRYGARLDPLREALAEWRDE